jgi:folate-binding protein YgfZ
MHSSRLGHLATLRFSGRDAGRFLHNQLSADILALQEGHSSFACLCQPKGRVIALLLVWHRGDAFEVICPAVQQEALAQWLQRFVFRDDVRIEEGSEDVTGAFVQGADAAHEAAPGPASHTRPVPGFWYGTGAADSSAAADAEAFRAVELEHGICWLDAATSEQFLPQMLGAGSIGALNFRKGCYPGQEIVARTYYLGKLKQRPLVLTFSGNTAPTVMDKLELAEAPGSATSSSEAMEAIVVARALHRDGNWRALAVARPLEQPPADFSGAQLRMGDQHWQADGHWLAVPTKGD